jgi:hypothetical protein
MADQTTMQQGLAATLENLHAELAAAVMGLDTDAMHWHPGPGIASLAECIIAAAAAERSWISLAHENLAPEELASESSQHPLFVLGSTGQMTQSVLRQLTPDQWRAERVARGRTSSVAECLVHIVTVLARAQGNVEIIKALYALRTAA